MQVEAFAAKERRINHMVDVFWKSEDQQINKLNRAMLTCENLRQKLHLRKSKPDSNQLVYIDNDLQKLLEIVYPDIKLRPKITAIHYIGLAAMSLEDICTPVKV